MRAVWKNPEEFRFCTLPHCIWPLPLSIPYSTLHIKLIISSRQWFHLALSSSFTYIYFYPKPSQLVTGLMAKMSGTNSYNALIMGRVMMTERACAAHSIVFSRIKAAVTAYAQVVGGLTRGYGEIAVRIPPGKAPNASSFVRKGLCKSLSLYFWAKLSIE